MGQKPDKLVKERVDLTGKRNFSGTPHWHWAWAGIVWGGHTLLPFSSFSWSLLGSSVASLPGIPPQMPARQTQPRASQAGKAKRLLKMGGKVSQQGCRGKAGHLKLVWGRVSWDCPFPLMCVALPPIHSMRVCVHACVYTRFFIFPLAESSREKPMVLYRSQTPTPWRSCGHYMKET